MADRISTAPSNIPPEVVQRHYRALVEADRAVDRAVSARRHVLKAAKADGLSTTILAGVRRLAKQDSDEVAHSLRTTLRYLSFIGKPIGWDGQPVEDEPRKDGAENEHREWSAAEAGYETGKMGGHRDDNPFPVGSQVHVKWDEGYMRGQAEIAAEMGENAKPARGRRRRGGNPEDRPQAEAA